MTTTKKTSIPKINGFTRGLNTLQIFSYALMVIKIFLFSYVILPNFLLFMQVISAITYYPITILTIVCGYLATVSDPTDEVVTEERRCKLEGEPFDSNRYDYQCNYCNTSVSRESKHCRECDRCVLHFDHHCKWINNCVAKKNYKLFITLVLSLILSTTAFSINGFVFLIAYYSEIIDVLKDDQTFKSDPSQHWKAIVLIACVIIMSVFALLSGKLLSFHMYLMRNKLTTYDYLMDLREKKGLPKKSKGGKEQKNRAKISPTEEPRAPEQEDEDKKAFKFEGENDSHCLSAEQLMHIAKLKRLAMNLENTQRAGSEALGIDQVLQQHQTSEDFELTHQLSIKSPTSPLNPMQSFDNHNPEMSHSPKSFKFTIPIAPSAQEKKLKELLSGELPPVRPKHRVLKKAVLVETVNGEQTTISVLQDSSGRNKTSLSKNPTKEGVTLNSTEEKQGDTSEIKLKVPGSTIYKDNLLAKSHKTSKKI